MASAAGAIPGAAAVGGHLRATLSAERMTRVNAEKALQQMERQAGFSLTLLRMIESSAVDPVVQQAAGTYFKNFVKRSWDREEGEVKIAETERNTIKSNIVNLMCSVRPALQRLLSDSLTLISKHDFPERWDTLLDTLISRLNTTDFKIINGILETANSIFKRFRNVFESNAIKATLKHCLDKFAKPLLQIFQALCKMIVPNAQNKAQLTQVLAALRTVARIFYSLNWITIPEFFEDHQAQWMEGWHYFLGYSNPVVEDKEEEDEAGPVERLQAAVVENINLYSDKYDEEFETYFPKFVTAIWELLLRCPNVPKYDALVTRSMRFLVSVVGKAMHKKLFEDPAKLKQIIEKVVLPNLMLREADEDLFEDNWKEYLRRDIEGSDSDTRRRTATNLVRELCKLFEKPVSQICVATTDALLAQYAKNPASEWKCKEAAITLLIAVTVKGFTMRHGASAVNANVDVGKYFAGHIQPELSASDINASPIIKAACIKFVSTFRNQLPKANLVNFIPIVGNFLRAKSHVVHSYAASAIERILSVRETMDAKKGIALAVKPATLKPYIEPMLKCLFEIMSSDGYPENEYMMKCLTRIVYSAKAEIMPCAAGVLKQISAMLAKVVAKQMNPLYDHYLFECLAALVKNVCIANPPAVADFEKFLFPSFENILKQDVMDFLPYVFQLMSQLLHLTPAGRVGGPGQNLSPAYVSLLKPLLNASMWDRKGNVPSLVALMSGYMRQGHAYIAANNMVVPILGVFQKLLSARTTEMHGFMLLSCATSEFSLDVMKPFLSELFAVMFRRRTKNNTIKFARLVVEWTCLTIAKFGPGAVVEAINKVQANLFPNVLKQLILATAPKIVGRIPRRTVAIGLTRVLCELPGLLDEPQAETWVLTIKAVITLFEGVGDAKVSSAEAAKENMLAAEEGEDQVDAEYTGTHAQLAHAATAPKDALAAAVPNAPVFFVKSLVALSQRNPGKVQAVVAKLDGRFTSPLDRYMAASGVTKL